MVNKNQLSLLKGDWCCLWLSLSVLQKLGNLSLEQELNYSHLPNGTRQIKSDLWTCMSEFVLQPERWSGLISLNIYSRSTSENPVLYCKWIKWGIITLNLLTMSFVIAWKHKKSQHVEARSCNARSSGKSAGKHTDQQFHKVKAFPVSQCAGTQTHAWKQGSEAAGWSARGMFYGNKPWGHRFKTKYHLY